MREEKPVLWWHRLLWPLISRKGQVALTSVVAMWLAAFDLGITEAKVASIVGTAGVAAALMLGISGEDAAKKLGQ